jgi:hypothetical protein
MEYYKNLDLEDICYLCDTDNRFKFEQWKNIIGYEGIYSISNLGRVKSANYNGTNTQRIMKSRVGMVGYVIINFHKNLKRKTKTIHRLLAIHFIPNPENKKEVNHIDGDKSNCNIENLEWCTRSENKIHAHKLGLEKARKGVSSNFSKLTEVQVLEIRKVNKSMFQKDIAKMYNVSRATITMILNRRTWSHI